MMLRTLLVGLALCVALLIGGTAVSTFNTDCVLVKDAKVDASSQTLRAAGHTVDGA